jgi:hypothetical protein
MLGLIVGHLEKFFFYIVNYILKRLNIVCYEDKFLKSVIFMKNKRYFLVDEIYQRYFEECAESAIRKEAL